jgi:hypothetical protein
MPVSLMLDECSRAGSLWSAIQSLNLGPYKADIIRVGDPGAPPNGTSDPQLLRWAVMYGRTIVTQDAGTMVSHHALLASSSKTTGLIVIRRGFAPFVIADELHMLSVCYDPDDVASQCLYLPFGNP